MINDSLAHTLLARRKHFSNSQLTLSHPDSCRLRRATNFPHGNWNRGVSPWRHKTMNFNSRHLDRWVWLRARLLNLIGSLFVLIVTAWANGLSIISYLQYWNIDKRTRAWYKWLCSVTLIANHCSYTKSSFRYLYACVPLVIISLKVRFLKFL